MARSHSVTVEVALPPQQAEAAVYQALVSAGVTGARGGGGFLRGAYTVSLLSWGEDVTASIGFGQRGSVVTLTSESSMPTQVVDWGRNRRNVERILGHLRAAAPVV